MFILAPFLNTVVSTLAGVWPVLQTQLSQYVLHLCCLCLFKYVCFYGGMIIMSLAISNFSKCILWVWTVYYIINIQSLSVTFVIVHVHIIHSVQMVYFSHQLSIFNLLSTLHIICGQSNSLQKRRWVVTADNRKAASASPVCKVVYINHGLKKKIFL